MQIQGAFRSSIRHCPAISLLDINLKEYKLEYNRDTCTPMVIAVLFTGAKL
jgi:hypothetical protein